VPALNEEHTVPRVIAELRSFDPGLDIVVIDDGRVAEIGDHDELVALGGIYARLVSAQTELSKQKPITAEENGLSKVIVFSGDLGPYGMAIVRDAENFSRADVVFMESTYGDRIRAVTTPEQRRQHLASEVRDAASAKGALLIPAFAVERTQELIVDLVDLALDILELGEDGGAGLADRSPAGSMTCI